MDIATIAKISQAKKKFQEGGKQLHEKKATQITILQVPFRQAGGGKALKTRKVKIQPRLGKVATDCGGWLGLSHLQHSFEALLNKQIELREQVHSRLPG